MSACKHHPALPARHRAAHIRTPVRIILALPMGSTKSLSSTCAWGQGVASRTHRKGWQSQAIAGPVPFQGPCWGEQPQLLHRPLWALLGMCVLLPADGGRLSRCPLQLCFNLARHKRCGTAGPAGCAAAACIACRCICCRLCQQLRLLPARQLQLRRRSQSRCASHHCASFLAQLATWGCAGGRRHGRHAMQWGCR